MLRARRCADALARQYALTAELRPALREIHFGAWEGLRWDDIETRHREDARRWIEGFPGHTPPGAEPYTNFTVRIHEDGAHWLSDPSCETLALVTHRGVLQYLLQAHWALASSAAENPKPTPHGALRPRADATSRSLICNESRTVVTITTPARPSRMVR